MPEYKNITELKKQISDFKKAIDSPNNDYMTGYISALSVVEGMICGLPSEDVEVVIRCKDCHSFRRNIGFVDSPNGQCIYHDVQMNGFDHCSYGVKKNEEGK